MTKAKIAKRLEAIIAQLENAREEIDAIKSEAQDYFDGKSERWQEGEKGEEYQEHLDNLQTGYDDLDSMLTALGDAFTD